MLSEDYNSAKRRRVARACDVCRRKKVRCDGVQPASDPPSCTNCKIYGHECSFIDAPKKRGPPKGYVDALETRLQRMESVVNGLVQSGRLHESTVRSALTQNGETSRGLQKTLLRPMSSESFHGSPSVSSTDEGFSSDSNGSQSDMSESGHFVADEKGSTRYIGKSSGLLLFKYTKKVVDRQLTVVCEEFHPPKRLADKRIISELPTKKLCDQLLDIYWKNFSFYPPIIDRQDFMEKYDNMDASYNHIILLYTIIAVASKFVDNHADFSSTSGIDYYDRACELLREEFDNSTLSIIQSLLLLAGHQKDLHKSRAWIFVGIAIRLAQDMGLHRDTSNWILNEREAEVRRRVWWACVTFDSFLSIALGRPLAINVDDCDAPYPVAGRLLHDQPDSIEIFTQYTKAALIISRISKHVYGITSKQTESILSSLDAELNEWRENLPPQFQYDRLKKQSDDPSYIIVVLLNLTYHTIQINLHRPYIRCPKSKAPPSSIPSLTICTVAASNITHIMYRIVKKGGHRWRYALYPFFTAMSMHIINALSDDERFREVAKQGLRMSMKCLEHMKPYLKETERILYILNDLLKIKNINLDGPDDEIPKTKDKNSANDSKHQCIYFMNDAEVGSRDKSLERPRITFASSSPVSHGSPQTVDQEQNNNTGSSEMNYEFVHSSGSSPFIPSTQPNEFNDFSELNESFPPNTNAFIPETSSLLFNNVGNYYGLSVPNSVDWTELSNWTEYMIKLQTSRNNS